MSGLIHDSDDLGRQPIVYLFADEVDALAREWDTPMAQEVKLLRAQVQAVRDAVSPAWEPAALMTGEWWLGYYECRDRVRTALDGPR